MTADIEITGLHRQVSYLYESGVYGAATVVAKDYVAAAMRLFGQDHPTYASALGWLALVYSAQGRYADAEPLAKRALAIEEKSFGPDSLNAAAYADSLAQLYQEQGKYAEAEPLFNRSLAIVQKKLGAEDPRVGSALNNLAWFYQLQGRYAEAEPLATNALTIAENALGAEITERKTHAANVGRIRDTLARTYEGMGKLKEAELEYKRAIEMLTESLGADHPEIGIVHGNLGGLYKAQGRLEAADPLLKSALEASEKLGHDHPRVARALTQLADLYRLQGRCDNAEPLILRARQIGKQAFQEVAVLFGTDRRRDETKKTLAFGGDRADKLSYGLTIVTLPNEKAASETATHDVAGFKAAPPKITEARRFAMHCLQEINAADVVATARRRSDESKTHPKQVLVFVHGYNVSFESGLRRAAQIAYDIGFDGSLFLFSWPVHEGSMAWVWDYLSARDTVDLASEHLRQFLEGIVEKTNAKKVHFVAHSMGNMVLLRALERLSLERSPVTQAIGEIIQAAPDVDPDLFIQMARKIKATGANLTLYASSSDKALQFSGWLRYRPRAGYIREKPLIVLNAAGNERIVDTIDITKAGSSGWYDLFAFEHDVYSSNSIIVGDIRRIIESGQRPPDSRTKEFEPVGTSTGAYWKLVPPQPTASVQ